VTMLANAASASATERRRQIESRAAALTDAGRARPRLHVVGRDSHREDLPQLLCQIFEALGGAFVLFGRYLAGRPDLLSPRYLIALECLRDWTEPLGPDTVRQIVAGSLGDAADRFASFEELPFESRLAWQAHRARLTDGRAVIVRVRHAALARDVEHLELLELFAHALSPAECSADAFRAAVDDFRQEFRDALDLRRDRNAFDELAEDASAFDLIASPHVCDALSADAVLTIGQLSMKTIADYMRSDDLQSRRDELARLLTLAWLRQAVAGRVFPAVVRPESIEVCGLRRIAFTEGPFHSTSPHHQSALRDYLLNTDGDPDRACAAFLRLMRNGLGAAGAEKLRRQFRQTVPFRDLESSGLDGDWFEQHLWVHWRHAAHAGCVPLPHVPAFYRGLTGVARIAHALSPGEDVVRSAVNDLRALENARDVLEAINPVEVGRLMSEYLQLALIVPGRVDDLLQKTSDGRARLRVGVADDDDEEPRPRPLLLVGVSLCSAIVLLGPYGAEATAWTKVTLLALLTLVLLIVEGWD